MTSSLTGTLAPLSHSVGRAHAELQAASDHRDGVEGIGRALLQLTLVAEVQLGQVLRDQLGLDYRRTATDAGEA